ncbi:MAG TPA: hypothetical protein VNF27_04740 [Candidatus Binataceae bacterium]|nr:hypothetical protein [Candidatus Binataceae bacterium]
MPESRYSGPAFGQVVVGGPATPVPLTPPPRPGQPQALSTIGAIPQLAPAPGSTNVLAASAAATPRQFECTCAGPGYPTEWAGRVAASSYILARRTATGQCVSYKLNGHALSPYISPPNPNPFQAPLAQPPGGLYSFPPGQVTTPLTVFPNQPLANNARMQVSAQCQNCACN